MHRYQLVYLYYKHREKKVTEAESRFADLPRVTIQLPIFNEQYVIDRLVECVCKIEYRAKSWKSRYSTIQPMKPSR